MPTLSRPRVEPTRNLRIRRRLGQAAIALTALALAGGALAQPPSSLDS